MAIDRIYVKFKSTRKQYNPSLNRIAKCTTLYTAPEFTWLLPAKIYVHNCQFRSDQKWVIPVTSVLENLISVLLRKERRKCHWCTGLGRKKKWRWEKKTVYKVNRWNDKSWKLNNFQLLWFQWPFSIFLNHIKWRLSLHLHIWRL